MVEEVITNVRKKTSLPMEIPKRRRSSHVNDREEPFYHPHLHQHQKKISNPVNIINVNNFKRHNMDQEALGEICGGRRRSGLLDSGGEENNYILLNEDEPTKKLTNSRIDGLINNNRVRKTSAILSGKPLIQPSSLTKKKKSSSGISSSSDDANVYQMSAYQDYGRKTSDESLDEINSSSSSPKDNRKKISQDENKRRKDLGYCSRRSSSKNENFHTAVTQKLSIKEKKESLIGMFEQLSTAGIQESRTNSIYDFKRKRRSATTKLNQENEVRNRSSIPNTNINNEPVIEKKDEIDNTRRCSYSLNTKQRIDERKQSNFNRKQSIKKIETFIPSETFEQSIDDQDLCSDDISLEALPPPKRRISATINKFEPRRRVSAIPVEELNEPENKEEKKGSKIEEIRKKISTSINRTEKKTTPQRRFSSHVPAVTNKLLNQEPKRRFSSVIPYQHNSDSSMWKQLLSFKELQSKFSEEVCPPVDEDNDLLFEERENCSIFSRIDTQNNIFIKQIESEKLQNDKYKDMANKSEGNSPCAEKYPLSAKNVRRYSSYNPPIEPKLEHVPVRKNNSVDQTINKQPLARRTSLTVLQNIPWGDKRLSKEVNRNRENTITECSSEYHCISPKEHSSDGNSTISTLSLQSNVMYQNEKDMLRYTCFSNDEKPVSPEFRMSVRSFSSHDNTSILSSADESDGDEQAAQRPSIIYRPKLLKKEENGADFNSDPEQCYRTLGDIDNHLLEIEGNRSIASSIDSDFPEISFRPRSNTHNALDDHSIGPAKDRRRKFGITHIRALENIPKRRVSLMQDYAFSDHCSTIDDHELPYIPPDSSMTRRFSTYGSFSHPLVTFDNEENTEVVSDQTTLDVIIDSLDALSSVSDSGDGVDGDPTPFSFTPSTNDPYMKSLLTNVAEETEYESPLSFLEKRKKELKLNDLKDNDTMWTPKADTANKSFFDGSEHQLIHSRQLPSDERKGTRFSVMFGYFNYFLYIYVTKVHGQEKWRQVVKEMKLSRIQRDIFEKPKHTAYDDDLTNKMLRTSSDVMEMNFNLFLQNFGGKYYEYCSEKYGDILKSIATNLKDFINNMNDIRRHIHKIEKIPDDFPPSIHATFDKKGALLMYYKSCHEQNYLEYFMMGFIKQAAFNLFGMKSRISLHHHKRDIHDYSIISIKSFTSLIKKPSLSRLQVSNRAKDLIIEPYFMDSIFPFHIIINFDKFEIVQLGHSLNRFLEKYISIHGLNFHTYFKVNSPMIDFTLENIRKNLNTAFNISLCKSLFPENSYDNAGFVLKGQIVLLESSKCIWFMGSPKVDYVHHLNNQSNLYLSDIPLHDVTREVLLVGEQKHSVETLKTQLEILTNRLKETSKELALGKINTENILDQMFPKDVADKLMRDQPVPSVTTETVTILFTDIVGFTSICEQCDPEEVTVMLNKLYIDFDYLCEKYEIYKVETIGDAYMAVGGLHQTGFDHGRWVTAMGTEMIRLAQNVNIPRTNRNIEIRVGIHSGSVVAGVVGTLMPRYCLFGKNVTLANKMESTSESGKVHISPATYLEIKHHQEFIFWRRPREDLPELMAKSYDGNSFFVKIRRNSNISDIPCSSPERRRPYMMESRGTKSRASKITSRKNSRTESVNSDASRNILPENLKIQCDALDKINRFGNWKILCMSDSASTT